MADTVKKTTKEVCPNCGSDRREVNTGRSQRMNGKIHSDIGIKYTCLRCGHQWRHGQLDAVRARYGGSRWSVKGKYADKTKKKKK